MGNRLGVVSKSESSTETNERCKEILQKLSEPRINTQFKPDLFITQPDVILVGIFEYLSSVQLSMLYVCKRFNKLFTASVFLREPNFSYGFRRCRLSEQDIVSLLGQVKS